jgi:hypothetical protein
MPADDDLIGDFHVPLRHAKIERSIGRFIIAWGTLERELDLAFPVLLRIDPTLALCLTANLGTKAKLDILSSVITTTEEILPAKIIAKVRALISQIRNLSGSARNTVAHAQPWIFGYPDDAGSHEWLFTRLAAREELDVAVYPTTPKYWEALAVTVLKHARNWHNHVADIQAALTKISDADFNYACHFRGREVGNAFRELDDGSILRVPRTRPVPRLRGLKGRSTKRGR